MSSVNEKQLALLSLFLALVGLGAIALSTKGLKAKEVAISDLGSLEGQYVEVSGTVSSFRTSKGNVFFTICSFDCVPVAIFSGTAKSMAEPNPYLLKKGDRLVIRGEVQEYGGEPEIVVILETDLERG